MKARGILIAMCLMMGAAIWAQAGPFPDKPDETDWLNNKTSREDLRPLEFGDLLSAPVIDGQISPGEWAGATQYQVYSGPNLLGVLYFGAYGNRVYTANDWLYNDNPNPLIGAGNAWRIGTSSGPGPGNVDSFFDVFVEATTPGSPNVWYRPARPTEEWQAGDPDWTAAPSTLLANAGWNAGTQNWQYELGLGDPFPLLPVCWHWEWRQIDPRPDDGFWEPVYDGSVHHTPEPALIQLPALLLLGGLGLLRRKRAARL